MKPEYSFKEIKEHLKAQPPIRFNISAIDEKNVDALIRVFFSKYNRNYNTIYDGNHKVQTQAGKRRSISDIFRICYFYFPRIRLTTVYKTLLKYIKSSTHYSYICHATGLRVYRDASQDVYGGGNFFNGPLTDEYGVDFTTFEELEGISINKKGGNTEDNDQFLKYIDLK